MDPSSDEQSNQNQKEGEEITPENQQRTSAVPIHQRFCSFRNTRQKRKAIITTLIGVYFILFKVASFQFSATEEIEKRTDIQLKTIFERRETRDFLHEDELKNESVFDDYMMSSNASQSIVVMKAVSREKQYFKIGEKIYVSIQLYDGYGMPKRLGGDHLRIRMKEDEVDALSVGYVIDHNNGTYTGVVTALWAGRPTIEVGLFYTREAIRAVYTMRRTIPSTRVIMALFESEKGKEATECHPFPFSRQDEPTFCDMSTMNSGMSWYCRKPVNSLILCSDWTKVKAQDPLPDLPLTNAEMALLSPENVGLYLPDKIRVQVFPTINELDHYLPGRKCIDIDKVSLWEQQSPTGYYYKNSWKIRNCQGPRHRDEMLNCLRCREIHLIGDAIIKTWFQHFVSTLRCVPTDQNWSSGAWYKPVECRNYEYNFKVQWHAHSMPINIGKDWETKRYVTDSIPAQIDKIDTDSKLVIVVHLYTHALVYSPEVFTDRMRKIRGSIERLFERKTDAVVVIKGPHTFRKTALGGPLRQCDYFGYVYRDIIAKEFEGVKDKVIFLDQMDISTAKDLTYNYGDRSFAFETLKQMLAFICDFHL